MSIVNSNGVPLLVPPSLFSNKSEGFRLARLPGSRCVYPAVQGLFPMVPVCSGKISRQSASMKKGKCGQLRTVPHPLPQARS